MNTNDRTDLMLLQDAADHLHRHGHTLRRWIKEGRIRSHRGPRGRIYVYSDEVYKIQSKGLDSHPPMIEGTVVAEDIAELKDGYRLLAAELERTKNAVTMLTEELGYGSHLDGIGAREMRALHKEATQLLVVKDGWTIRDINGWAEKIMSMRDSDIKAANADNVYRWKPIYVLMSRMRAAITGVTVPERILKGKTDRALAHLRSLVFIESQLTPLSDPNEKLERVAMDIGAVVTPTTIRLLEWIDRGKAA